MSTLILEQVTNILQTMTSQRPILTTNEAQTRFSLVNPFLQEVLGFGVDDIRVEYGLSESPISTDMSTTTWLDYALLVNKQVKLLVESKHLGVNLFSCVEQLSGYFTSVLEKGNYIQGELIGILTDGNVYLFYSDLAIMGKMDALPYFQVILDSSEDAELLKLSKYTKESLQQLSISCVHGQIDLSSELEDLSELYRLDSIEGIYTSYMQEGVKLKIKEIYFNNRLFSIHGVKSDLLMLRLMYKELLRICDAEDLYRLCERNDSKCMESKNVIHYCSLSHIFGDNLVVQWKGLSMYFGVDLTLSGMINRILYVADKCNFGRMGLLVRLCKE